MKKKSFALLFCFFATGAIGEAGGLCRVNSCIPPPCKPVQPTAGSKAVGEDDAILISRVHSIVLGI